MGIIVAIDGPAGSGKGTVTKKISNALGLVSIDTGATYRCVALNMLQRNVKLNEEEKIKQILENINIDLKPNGKIFLNGDDVTDKIRTPEVSEFVSQVSTLKIVRDKMVDIQRKMSVGKNVIMDGRDIGTIVFPNANVKIYLDASPEVRAERRMKQMAEKGTKLDYEQVLKEIIERDTRDSNRAIAPLKQADDAIYVDSSKMTIDEVTNKIIEIIKFATRDVD